RLVSRARGSREASLVALLVKRRCLSVVPPSALVFGLSVRLSGNLGPAHASTAVGAHHGLCSALTGPAYLFSAALIAATTVRLLSRTSPGDKPNPFSAREHATATSWSMPGTSWKISISASGSDVATQLNCPQVSCRVTCIHRARPHSAHASVA